MASLSSQPDWDNEEVKWESPDSGKPVYRLYSLITNNHLYTSDNNEVNTLLDSKAWTIDNDGESVFYSGGDKNIYRLYNEGLKMHLLTTDEEEYNTLPDHG